jgi:hypothetical protein
MDYTKANGGDYFSGERSGNGAALDQPYVTTAEGGLPNGAAFPDTAEGMRVDSGAGPSIEGTNQDDLPTIEAARPNCIAVESKVPDSCGDSWAPYSGNGTM